MARLDPHSYADADQPRVTHVDLRLDLDFDEQRIDGEATLGLAAPSEGALDLDSDGIEIAAVETPEGRAIQHELHPHEPLLGRRLRLFLPGGTQRVRLLYRTSSDAAGLSWLSPAQTSEGTQPFLFSQCQPTHARSLVPLPDTPRQRITYSAEVVAPQPLTAVMAAAGTRAGAGPRPGTRSFRFHMPQAIPPYLVALAVGTLEKRELSARAAVWAEPQVLDAAAHEFGEIETILERAEALFGPYEWDRYDMLVLPPAFPYGGMENPRLTFLTPTLLAGDRSLVDVVLHEVAHSWTGNLVTNADMEHFWLNEGFTVWAERRLLEALRGEGPAMLAWAIGEKALRDTLVRLGDASPLTRLRTELRDSDPDDAITFIPYEKGARFVALLERTAGRRRFDGFMRAYLARHRFTSITTEEFLRTLEDLLPGVAKTVRADEWLHRPGLPDNAPVFHSPRRDALAALGAAFEDGLRPSTSEMTAWSAAETLVYLQNLPRRLTVKSCRWLDDTLVLTSRANFEILVEWLTIAAASGYEAAFPRLREVLLGVGRLKYLRPLYAALGHSAPGQAFARQVFTEAVPRYHPLSRRAAAAAISSYEPVGEKT